MVYELIICFIAGVGTGLGTGLADMSAAAVINPMLTILLHVDPYGTVGVALASDTLANAVSAYIYDKNKDLDIPNGNIMTVTASCFTLVGSWVSSPVPNAAMGSFSVFMILLLDIKFIVKPVVATKESMTGISKEKRIIQSIVCDIIVGFIYGFVDTGSGMIMLLILTSVLGCKLKTAIGISTFIMTLTALTGVPSRFTIDDVSSIMILNMCILPTSLWVRTAVRLANRTSPIVLNRATGVVLAVLGVAVLTANYLP